MEPYSRAAFPLRQAVCLGLAQGPAELLPVSSSAHITLIGWLAGWSYPDLDAELRKDFEVALHAGTAAALVIGARRWRAAPAGTRKRQRPAPPPAATLPADRRGALVLGLALAPPALAGLVLESRIERLGTPPRIAGGLLAGALALALADLGGSGARRASDAGPLDGLLLGLAQTAALVPGISRNGATLAVSRARGFGRPAADELSRDCGLPVILGAVGLRGLRWVRVRSARGFAAERSAAGSRIAAGGAAAFVSTLAARRLLERRDRPVSLLVCAAYRTALAGVVLARLRRAQAGG
ncbi:MAG TPA: undecaprenyl-diphosphate phosphatase [Solirubrobacteraceae bacterium]|jgi:undecaprenyl-diphosphatase|nr:undecaprenyl-diphosphate phosphatase [Solirubrobacteraceae bacterium]